MAPGADAGEVTTPVAVAPPPRPSDQAPGPGEHQRSLAALPGGGADQEAADQETAVADVFVGLEGPWWLGLPLALAIGLVLGASPFALPLLALATGARAVTTEGRRGTALSPAVLALGAAVVVVYASLGLAADRLDAVVRGGIGSWTGIGYAALAVVSVGAGAVLLARPALLCRTAAQPRRARGPVGAFALGIPAVLVNCPACAGIITGVALAAGAAGSTAYAVAAMAALGVGHALALVVGSVLLLRPFEQGLRVATSLQRLGAVLLLLVGVWYAVQAWRYGLVVAEPLP